MTESGMNVGTSARAGVKAPAHPIPMSAPQLGQEILHLDAPLREAFGARFAALNEGRWVDKVRVDRLFDLHVHALAFEDEPEAVSRELTARITASFADDLGAHDVAAAGDAFDWTLRDVFADRFGVDAGAVVREALVVLRGLTTRVVRHQTGEFPTDFRFHNTR
jgi:hypothetical protein